MVVDAPIFKQRINIDEFKIVEDEGKWFLDIKSASLVDKD